jgi:hypothetical protein
MGRGQQFHTTVCPSHLGALVQLRPDARIEMWTIEAWRIRVRSGTEQAGCRCVSCHPEEP